MSMVSTYPIDMSKRYKTMTFDPKRPFNDLSPLLWMDACLTM